MSLLLQIVLMISPGAQARSSLLKRAPTMTVWSKNSNDHLRSTYPNQRIDYLDQRTIASDEAEEGYVPPLARDALFEKCELTAALAQYDDLDKDMLVMALKDSDQADMERLLKGYPNLTMAQLKRLKSELAVKP